MENQEQVVFTLIGGDVIILFEQQIVVALYTAKVEYMATIQAFNEAI